jgi:hypothetical protein
VAAATHGEVRTVLPLITGGRLSCPLMRRRLFTVLSALSLVLLLAVGLGWASSTYDDVRVR